MQVEEPPHSPSTTDRWVRPGALNSHAGASPDSWLEQVLKDLCHVHGSASRMRSRVGMTVSYSPYGALLRSLDVLHSLHYWYRCHAGASTGHRPSHCLANMTTLPPLGLDHDTKAQSTHLNPVRRDSSVGMAPDKELFATERYLLKSKQQQQ